VPTTLSPALWRPEAYLAHDSSIRTHWVIYVGMALALGLFNLMLAFALRDGDFLIYVGSLASIVSSHHSARSVRLTNV
jgi:hypothetical protein